MIASLDQVLRAGAPGFRRLFSPLLALLFPFLLALLAFGAAASAQSFADPYRITARGGQAIYEDLCQGCHMPEGRGAVGAGSFPRLADDEKLAAGGYAVSVVVRGSKGMPAMGYMLDDEQVAAVVNYVRTHFGNSHQDAVSAADARGARGN
ncbi:MAG: c-type cytochrome [Hyphomicrobiales bacterium]